MCLKDGNAALTSFRETVEPCSCALGILNSNGLVELFKNLLRFDVALFAVIERRD